MSGRTFALILPVLMGVLAVLTAVYRGQLPPADFTFVNETEIESLDPAVVTGQPEGRVLWGIFEGLTRPDPVDLHPIPGVAREWDLSDDGKTYTFYLRDDAKWSDGTPVTADDFVYSLRRFLDPQTLAEYAYQAWYLKNAHRYSRAARGVTVGDLVEVELHDPPAGGLPHARGEVLRGKLVDVVVDRGADASEDSENYSQVRTFVVEIDARRRTFRIGGKGESFAKAEVCKQLLLDFSEVGVRALVDLTVEMVLESPTPFWLNLMAFYPLSPVNRRCVETYGSPHWTDAENIVTNGAYTVGFRRIRDRVRMVKNPYYWNRDEVAFGVIDALSVESLTTAFNMYETGQVDWITKVAPLIARELMKAEQPRDDFNPQPQFTTYFYLINVTRPPLDDVRVRRALNLALDRDEIIRTACAGEVSAHSLVPPGLPEYVSQQCEPMNVAKARELLAEAGFPEGNGFPKLEILYNTEEVHQTIAELIRKQWQRSLGINVTIRNEEWGTYQSSTRFLQFDVARRAWGGDYLDANTFLDMFVTDGENNNTGWSNAEYDRLIKAIQSEPDVAKRREMLQQAERIMMDEMPILPIYFYVNRNLVKPHVRGFYNNLQDIHPVWALSFDREGKTPNEFMRKEVK